MRLEDAKRIAENLIGQMQPYCDRISLAGSIRREVANVKDIELVVIPKREIRVDVPVPDLPQGELWSEWTQVEGEQINLLFENWAGDDSVTWIKPGVSSIERWPINANGKYWRGYLPEHDIKLDVFLVQKDNWGIQLAIRTGDADFSRLLVTRGKIQGKPSRDGFLVNAETGDIIPTLEESDVFRELGIEYVRPQQRNGKAAFRFRRAE